jgi:hypothetical protein
MKRNNCIGHDTNMMHMLGDNMGAITLTKNSHLNERLKHIDIYYHFVCDLARKGCLQVSYVPTANMVADVYLLFILSRLTSLWWQMG